jgi:ubiquinone/menaquinone biosynthesis C-methylase UbiE
MKLQRTEHTVLGYTEHIQSYYQGFAGRYDGTEWFRRGLRKAAVELSGVSPRDSVLDVCTGTGEAALVFAARGAQVTGVDISPAMLAKAREKGGGIIYRLMDARFLDFTDGSFDIVNVQLGLHDMPRRVIREALREMARVAGRTVILAEPYPPRNRLLRFLFRYTNFGEFSEAFDWKGYTNLDLRAEIEASGLRIEEEKPVALGLVRVFRCSPPIFYNPPSRILDEDRG